MFARIARFELAYQLRQATLWVSFGTFFLLTFLAMTVDGIQIGSGGGTHDNAPFAIAQTLTIMSLFGMFIPVALMPGIILRDADTGMSGIVYSLPIDKTSFLLGRFVGAFAVVCLGFIGAPLGVLIGSWMWWLDPEELGPTRLDVYIQTMTVMVIPNLLVFSGLFFATAAIFRSQWAAYTALIAFLVMWATAGQLLEGPENHLLEALVDPFGLAASGQLTRYWTVFERNTMLIPLEGALLYNRLLWLGVGLALVTLAVVAFRFETNPKRAAKAPAADTPAPTLIRQSIAPAPAGTVAWRQLAAQTRMDVLGVIKSPGFLVILALGLFNAAGSLFNLNGPYGTPPLPVTRIVADLLVGTFGIVPFIVIIYYTGELVWRDRQLKTAEILGACPVPGWVFVMSKMAAVTVLLAGLFAVATLAGVVGQLGRGFTDIEPGIYLKQLYLFTGISLLTTVALALFIQALSSNKFIGMLGLVGFMILTLVANNIGLVDNLILFGGGPSVPLSDMNGTGHFAEAALWFNLYWGLLAVFLLVLAHRMWPGAVHTPLRVRARALLRGWTPGPAIIASLALLGFAGTGGWIAYNTHGLNEVVSEDERDERTVAFEKAYRQYENLPQPRIVDVRVDLDIFPQTRGFTARGTYILENRTDAPIADVHIVYEPELEVVKNDLQGGTVRQGDEKNGYYIFALDQPMQPGEKRTLNFETVGANPGFKNNTDVTPIVYNGSFINNFAVTPSIGFPQGAMLQDRAKRRKYGLEPIDRMADLDDKSSHGTNYIRDDSDWVGFETIVSTTPDQIAVAPGYLQREWVENGRRYFHYKMDAPILNFYSWLSARYTVKTENWEGIDLSVYFHEPHAYNVDRMLDSMKKSIKYFSAAFSPYQHRQLRVLEFPAYAGFAQSFPNTVPYSEAVGFIADLRDPEDIDYVFYITAHEVAHQWWAHQVIGADVQGSTLLSETFSQYAALMVMEQEYGPDKMRKFLKYELDQYLRGRGGEDREERPLARVENQQYIHYEKGSVAMYALKDYLGEQTVNRALARLVKEVGYKFSPYPTSRDFIRILREEAGAEHQQLITDLFEKIVLWDLKAADHKVEKTPDGKWKVTLTLETTKLEADGKGKETTVPLDQMIDIGLFARDPGDVEFTAADVIHLQKHRINTDKPVIELIVDREPAALGIDPYNKLIDRNSDDNIQRRTVDVAAK